MTALELGSSARSTALELAPLFATGPELGTTERAREFVSEMIEGTPTLFGRLEVLANLQEALDRDIQLTADPTLERGEMRKALQRAHKDILCQWLSRSFAHRLTDMTVYFGRLGAKGKGILTNMIQTEGYRRLIPQNADPCHHQHFLADVRVLLALVVAAM